LRGGGGRSRIALLFCLLIALAWQSCLTQTHVHSDQGLRAISSLASVRADTGGGNPSDTPATCPICQEAALSGHYVAAGPVLLAPPAVAIAWYGPAVSRPTRRDLKSHAWNSRAPPARSTLPTA
jgi:hypothetical protein